VGRVEAAFVKVLNTQPYADKIKKAIKQGKLAPSREFEDTVATAVAAGILTQSQADELLEAERARLDAIQVDEYSQEYIRGQFAQIEAQSSPEAA
jgi:flagellar biosynthesis protein FlhB